MFSSAKFPKIDFNELSNTLTDSEKQMLPFIFHKKTGELRKSKVKFAPLKATKAMSLLFIVILPQQTKQKLMQRMFGEWLLFIVLTNRLTIVCQ